MKPGLSPNFLKILAAIFFVVAIALFASSFIFFDDTSKTGLLLVGLGLVDVILVSSLLKAIEKNQNINQFFATLPEPDSLANTDYTFD